MNRADLLAQFDWRHIARLVFTSRAMDDIEETELVPKKQVLYQFSARGHDVTQIILGSLLQHPKDVVGAYYRSRPLMLTLGLDFEDALAGPMGKSGGYSNGKDIGVVCNLPSQGAASVLPMAGDVGSQYTPTVGAAQAIEYRRKSLQDNAYGDAIAVVLGGEGSVATNGFWASLTIATTLNLPMLFYIEDNGYAISVTSEKQTPGKNIAENLASFKNLQIWDGDGCDPAVAAPMLIDAVAYVRDRKGPALIRLTVPRLSGHSGQDTQTYKPAGLVENERTNDPLKQLEKFLVPKHISKKEWQQLQSDAKNDVQKAVEAALNRPEPDVQTVKKYVFAETKPDGSPDLPQMGGLIAEGHRFPAASETPSPEPARINMLTAIRRTMEHELSTNPKLLIFGEDVGPKGGVHAATMGLQEKFGDDRVFDTSLSEEGIIGRAVGMAICGLMPVSEIQFRKYADPAAEQLDNCGTIRWRTHNRIAAPMVVRMPGGFGSKCGDPWHSECNEVMWAHGIGWRVAFPSNAEDAVGLLRAAMRGNDPVIFFEHRHCLDMPWARRPYPGDAYLLPFGKARITQTGDELTVVTWGAMVERCETAAAESGVPADIIDLRTLSPWDKSAVIDSVRKTRRCLIVHEDGMTAGFGAEIAAIVAKECFFDLDAPVERLATPDIPVPYNVGLMNAVVPDVSAIAEKMVDLVEF
ncbi:MAG: pyruvate dehydrogenase [Calditrichaeota bacterium]|nr:pyruvate dehydrogenase [Calditrichota bacterium]MCB0269273.1 pyruvate dehydrogenase [Calditrichota bacterium]